MVKCVNCEREYEDDFSFCPYCGEEKMLVELSDEDRLKKVLPILKESFLDVTSVGVESLLLKLDEQKSLIVSTMDGIEALSLKIESEKQQNVEFSPEMIVEEKVECKKKEKDIERRKAVVQALSLISLSIGVVALVLGLILPFSNGYTGLGLLGEYFEKTFNLVGEGLNFKTLPTSEIMYYVSCWTLFVSLSLYVADVVLSVFRLINGKTKGRFFFLPTIGFCFGVVSLVCANIADFASIGAYVLCISLIFRIIISFFLPNTRRKDN